MKFFKRIKRDWQQIEYDNLMHYISISIEDLIDVGRKLGNSDWNIKWEIDEEIRKILKDKERYL